MADAYAEISALSYTLEKAQKAASAKAENTEMLPVEWNLIQKDFLKDVSSQSEDFILLSEFSEVEGPIPLLTIPLRVQETSEVDLNHFIIKIMSIDYQSSSSEQFNIFQDTQVLRTDVCQDFHAYIHYFTLYDLKARGFVRPFCLAFISCDHLKLQKNFAKLQKEFLKITRLMKYSNYHWFKEELQQFLRDLEHTRDSYMDLELRNLLETDREHAKKNTFDEEGKVIARLDPTGVGGRASRISQQLSEQSMVSVQQLTLNSLTHQATEYKQIINTVEPYLDDQAAESVISSWKRAVLSQPQSELCKKLMKLKIILPQPLIYVPSPLLPITIPGRTFTSLRSFYILCNWGLVAAFWKLSELHKYYSRDYLTLYFENLAAVLSLETSNQVNKDSSERKEPMTDNLEDLYCYKEYLENSDFCELFQISQRVESEVESVYADAEDIEELKLMASTVECSSSYHSAPESLNDIVGLHVEGPRANIPSSHSPQEEAAGHSASGRSGHSNDSNGSYLEISLTSSLKNMLTASASGSEDSSGTDGSSDEWDDRSGEAREYEKCSSDLFKKVEFNLGGKPGTKILKFFQHYSQVAHHILFSLFIGRTVIIAGPDESRNKVKEVLQALTPFIPTKPGIAARILRWHHGILVSSHTQSYRLIGLCVPERLSVHDMLSPREKNSVTILEVQKKKIFGPAYSGQLLTNFERNCQKHFKDEQSFMAYITSILVEIESKLYFYKFKTGEMDKDQKQLRDHIWSKSATEVSQSVGIQGSDIEMMKYLSKLLADSDDVTHMF